MKKIKNIEFLRVIGCLSVILLHIFAQFKADSGIFNDININTGIILLSPIHIL